MLLFKLLYFSNLKTLVKIFLGQAIFQVKKKGYFEENMTKM